MRNYCLLVVSNKHCKCHHTVNKSHCSLVAKTATFEHKILTYVLQYTNVGLGLGLLAIYVKLILRIVFIRIVSE